MYEQRAAVAMGAPIRDAFSLFTHFHRYPHFLRHVKSVEYYDDQNCHWVVESAGRLREFDAYNEGWRENARIGWTSEPDGFFCRGEVLFEPAGVSTTLVFVHLYGKELTSTADERDLQFDLERLARAAVRAWRPGEPLTWAGIGRLTRRVERGEIEADREFQRMRR